MRQFLKKSTWSFSSVIAKTLSGIIINKIFALQFGTQGITLLAHFQNLIGLVTQVPNDGVNRGIIRYWSNNELSPVQKNRLLVTGFYLNLIILAAGLGGVWFFQGYIFRFFNAALLTRDLVWIMVAAILVYILNLFLLSVILSFQKIRIYALINIAGAIAVTIVVYAGAQTHNISYALVAFLAGIAINFLFTIFYIVKHKLIKPVTGGMSVQNLKKLGAFVLMAVSVLACGKVVEFYMRTLSINEFGMNMTGLWQAVVKMSDGYTMVFINTVGIVYYPQISALIFDPDQLREYLKDVFRIVTLVTITGLFLIFIFRYPILTILYSHDFRAAADLMPLQLIGDFFCIISYLLTYIISAQARTRTFVMLQVISAVFYILLVHIMLPYLNIMTFPAAHAIRYVIYFIILITLNRRILF